MEWIGAGLRWEGTDASQPTLGTLANPAVAVCALEETVGVGRARLGPRPTCLVLNDDRIVLGLVAAEAMGSDDDQPVAGVMQGGPEHKPIGRERLIRCGGTGRPGAVSNERAGQSRPGELVTRVRHTTLRVTSSLWGRH